MLYQQLFDELLVEADQNYHGVLPIRVECWMDEFGNGLRPEGFEHLITTLRSRNIAVMLFLQSISQLQTMYKGDGWKVFMDSCAVFLFLGSGRGAYDTQETISKMLGAATIEKASGSVSYGQNGAAAQATIACSVRLWMQMKLHKWIKTVASFFHLQVNQSSTKNISHSMIPLI